VKASTEPNKKLAEGDKGKMGSRQTSGARRAGKSTEEGKAKDNRSEKKLLDLEKVNLKKKKRKPGRPYLRPSVMNGANRLAAWGGGWGYTVLT